MAYDEALAERIRAMLAGRDDVSERKMFGGLTFMVSGRMACGVVRDELMVRVGDAAHDAAIAEPHVRVMDFTNKPMRGFLYVGAAGIATDEGLRRWVDQGADYAASLPVK